MDVEITHFLDESEPGEPEELRYRYEGDSYRFADDTGEVWFRTYVRHEDEASTPMPCRFARESLLVAEAAHFLRQRGVRTFLGLDTESTSGAYGPFVPLPWHA